MRSVRIGLISAIVVGGFGALAHRAEAGPMATAQAYVNVTFEVVGETLAGFGSGSPGLIDPLALSISGDAPLALTATVNVSLGHPGIASESSDSFNGFYSLTNTSDHPIVVQRNVTWGLSYADASVDWPNTQSAEFSVALSGPYFGDSNACSILPGGAGSAQGAMYISSGSYISCFVNNPDYNVGNDQFEIAAFDTYFPGDYQVHAFASVAWVPEPISASLLGFGLLGLAAVRRRH
jgi:hypothetical protein